MKLEIMLIIKVPARVKSIDRYGCLLRNRQAESIEPSAYALQFTLYLFNLVDRQTMFLQIGDA